MTAPIYDDEGAPATVAERLDAASPVWRFAAAFMLVVFSLVLFALLAASPYSVVPPATGPTVTPVPTPAPVWPRP